MISYFDAILNTVSIHQSGNKLLDEKYKLSARPFEITDDNLNKGEWNLPANASIKWPATKWSVSFRGNDFQ